MHRFVIHRHAASYLHYDLRLEVDGVLKSWALPKGIPKGTQKHLAVQVEDHPYAYRTFAGVIPEGNYGAGKVTIWDSGTYKAVNAITSAQNDHLMKTELRKGALHIAFRGKKLHGPYALIRFRRPDQWLLFKQHSI